MAHDTPVVKGEAQPGEIAWRTLYNGTFSVLPRRGEKDIRNLNAIANVVMDPDVIGSELKRYDKPMQVLALQVTEQIAAEDTEGYAQMVQEFTDDQAKQDCEGSRAPNSRRRLGDPMELAYQVIFKARELDRMTREENARPWGE